MGTPLQLTPLTDVQIFSSLPVFLTASDLVTLEVLCWKNKLHRQRTNDVETCHTQSSHADDHVGGLGLVHA